MKNILLSALLLTVLFSCKKDKMPLPDGWKGKQTYGFAKAKRNGQEWEGSAAWYYPIGGDSSKIWLWVTTYQIVDSDTANVELVGLNSIMTKVGVYQLEKYEQAKLNGSPLAFYQTGFDDEIDAGWVNDEKYPNTVTVDSFDPVTRTITGRFNVTFKSLMDYTKDKGGFVSKVTFEDGTFEARYGGPQ